MSAHPFQKSFPHVLTFSFWEDPSNTVTLCHVPHLRFKKNTRVLPIVVVNYWKLTIISPGKNAQVGKTTCLSSFTSWWLNQPIWKIWVKLDPSSPTFGVNIKKYLKPTPPSFSLLNMFRLKKNWIKKNGSNRFQGRQPSRWLSIVFFPWGQPDSLIGDGEISRQRLSTAPGCRRSGESMWIHVNPKKKRNKT